MANSIQVKDRDSFWQWYSGQRCRRRRRRHRSHRCRCVSLSTLPSFVVQFRRNNSREIALIYVRLYMEHSFVFVFN